MQIFIGIVITLFFFIWSGLMIYVGHKLTIRIRTEPQKMPEDKKNELKRLEEGFQNIMHYDVGIAMQKAVSK